MATTHASQDSITKYKSCPLKKRPIKYEQAAEKETVLPAIAIAPLQYYAAAAAFQAATTSTAIKQEPQLELHKDEQPQDLSLKRKVSAHFEDYSVPAKREYVLNLSKDNYQEVSLPTPAYNYRPDSPANSVNSLNQADFAFTSSSAMLSPAGDYDETEYHHQMAPSNIHLRGLTAATSGYTTTSTNYKSAFMLAAGATPMTALWSAYQPPLSGSTFSSIFPSPASSIATSPRSVYSYHHVTPPSSPGSETGSEPEDLSVRSDIPLPALYHQTEQESSSSSSALSNSKSLKCYNSAVTSASGHHSAGSKANYRYKCDKCSKMYSTSIGLSKHQQFHCPAAECNQDKKQHSCHECGKLYTTVGALKMHIRTHTLPCKCPICGKAFSRPWLLQGHIRTHTGEKPFQCNDCPRSFADRSNLRAHQQTHVEVKRYACKVCNKSFSRMSLLNKHASSNCTITIV